MGDVLKYCNNCRINYKRQRGFAISAVGAWMIHNVKLQPPRKNNGNKWPL